jgi:hypothetical protein
MDLGEFAWSSKKLIGLGEDVEAGCQRFWSKNQLAGYDKDGNPIRTKMARERPTGKDIFHDWNTTSGGGEVFSNKPKKPGQYSSGGYGGV